MMDRGGRARRDASGKPAGLDTKGIVKKVFEALGKDVAKVETGRLA